MAAAGEESAAISGAARSAAVSKGGVLPPEGRQAVAPQRRHRRR